jgi:hypothetical protein
VRVTGVLSIDKGHDGSDLELHPVYGIDIIDATARDDWSGVWGDSSRFTYYIHQVLNSFWMLITTPYRDLGFVAVFQGGFQSDGVTVAGEWATVPLGAALGSGFMQFTLDSSRVKMIPSPESPLAGRVLQKLYNADGHPCPLLGKVSIGLPEAAVCQFKEIEGANVSYAAVNPAVSNYPDAAYNWTTTGGQIVGSSSQSTVQVIMPAAHTTFTIAVDITIFGACQYHAERTVFVRTPSEAYRQELWCQIRLAVGQLAGSFEEMAVESDSGSGGQPGIPDRATLERIQKIVDGTANALRRLRDHHRE